MRRDSARRIAVTLAAAALFVPVIGYSEQNGLNVDGTRSSHIERDRPRGLHGSTEQFLSEASSPGKLSFTHLSVGDGLSNADVRAIAQDRQGFIWFGTWLGGLNRYDGYTLKLYKHDDQDEGSLLSDTISGLFVDRAGVLWVITGNGVDRYDRDKDSFVHYRNRTDDPSSLPPFQSLMEDESGTLWGGNVRGLSRFDRTSDRFVMYTGSSNGQPSFGEIDVRSVCQDATTGLFWLGTWGEGVIVLDRATGRFTRHKNNPKDPASLSNNDVWRIFQDRKGNVWVSTSRGLNRFDPKTQRFVRYLHDPRNPSSLSDNFVATTLEDHAGRFWVGTNDGLNLMDRERGTFTRYLHDPNDPSTVSSNAINPNALYVDTSGALWIGMRSTGVDRLPGGAERFVTYRRNFNDAKSPTSNIITGLAVGSAGVLWIGTEAGLDRFDGRTFTHYLADPNDARSLSPGPQRCVAEDSHGAVWTGTYGGGLDRLDGKRVTHFRHDPLNSNSLANDNISTIVADNVGGLWIGVHGDGLDYFDGRHFTHFPPNPGNPSGLPGAYVLPLLFDARGMLWMGTSYWGLVRFDTHTRKFTTYLLDPNRSGGQDVNWTEDVYSDGRNLWVTSPRGLFRFDPKSDKFTHHYTEKDGLANNKVLGIQGDAQRNLWVSTANGMSKFDPRTETFRNYDIFDGLQGNGFSAHCHAEAPDGRLYFGGPNGLTAFYPDKFADNPTPPPVVLTEFELFNKPVKVGGKGSPLQQAINIASGITLHHDQSVFSFQFAALDFTAPQKNRYAYRLEGFDRDWQYADAARRFATYTNLDPGAYTFRVRASNNDGVWNEQGVVLHVTVTPPWWRTNWFRVASLAVFFTLVWGLHQLRMRQLAHEFNMGLEQRVAERTRIARELHDTLLQSFQALLPRLQASINMFGSRPDDARRNLEQAADQASQAIAEGRDAIQGMRMSTVEKNDLAVAIRTLGEELASAATKLPLPNFNVVVEGTSRNLHPILRDEVYRLATEALRNAFRHAAAQNVEVEIRYDEKYFRLRVRDDGKGIPSDVLSGDGREGHYGLPGMRERAKLVGGKLTIWTEVNGGTEIELNIPGARAFVKSTRPFWYFGKRSATEADEKEPIERE